MANSERIIDRQQSTDVRSEEAGKKGELFQLLGRQKTIGLRLIGTWIPKRAFCTLSIFLHLMHCILERTIDAHMLNFYTLQNRSAHTLYIWIFGSLRNLEVRESGDNVRIRSEIK